MMAKYIQGKQEGNTVKIKAEINKLKAIKIIELINQRADSFKRTINYINLWQVYSRKKENINQQS